MTAPFYALPMRKCDDQGCGHFGASRGSRLHNGIDLACNPGTAICSPINGKVTKIGYPYANDLSIRYVQVTSNGYDYRVFYVEPCVEVGDSVTVNDVIGAAQELESMNRGGTQHVHFEIKSGGQYIDPTPVYHTVRSVGRHF